MEKAYRRHMVVRIAIAVLFIVIAVAILWCSYGHGLAWKVMSAMLAAYLLAAAVRIASQAVELRRKWQKYGYVLLLREEFGVTDAESFKSYICPQCGRIGLYHSSEKKLCPGQFPDPEKCAGVEMIPYK